MGTKFSQYKRVLIVTFWILILISGCFGFKTIVQPDVADPNSSFEVPITVYVEKTGHDQTPFFGILLPEGWLVDDNISCTGVYSGILGYSSDYSDSMEAVDSAPDGYYWWVSVGSYADSINSGICSFTPQIHTDSQTGTFFIDYILGYNDSICARRSNNHPISVGMPMTATVTNTNNSGEGSLRQAMMDVSSSGEIMFDLTYPATITLDSQLVVDRNLTITGPTSGTLTVSGNNAVRVFNINGDLNVNMSNLTISNGNADGENGGGILIEVDLASDTLTLTNVTISGNTAVNGGGIYCRQSNLILSNVNIIRNNSSYGGGIYCCDSSSLSFDPVNRCNIFLNFAIPEAGCDLYANCSINVIVDTFTVLQPDDYFAHPIDNFTFDILNAKVEQVNQDLYVSPTGSDNNSGLTDVDPLLTISYAFIKILADSINPHTIYLANGTYSPSETGERFPLNCRSYVSLVGKDEASTILDGEDLRGILWSKEDNNFSIENMTIQNGSAEDGGGISCYNSSPRLENVTISGNTADVGGGISCYNSSPRLENVTISGNTADVGGGIYWNHSSPSLTNVTISGNYGRGIYCYISSSSLTNVTISGNYDSGIHFYKSSPSLTNVTISGNYGSGIRCEDSSPILNNVLIIENDDSGISCFRSNLSLTNVTTSENYGRGISCQASVSLSLVNCILWNDYLGELGFPDELTVSYSDIQGHGALPGIGNIDENPYFVPGPLSNYYLCPFPPSPCIDAGNPNAQYNDPEDPLNPGYAMYPALGTIRNDMGAYGGPGAETWTGVEEEEPDIEIFFLSQCKPNPFMEKTQIEYNLPKISDINISVYNVLGARVKTLLNEKQNTGRYTVTWDGNDERGNKLPSGFYFLRLEAGEYKGTRKLLLIK